MSPVRSVTYVSSRTKSNLLRIVTTDQTPLGPYSHFRLFEGRFRLSQNHLNYFAIGQALGVRHDLSVDVHRRSNGGVFHEFLLYSEWRP
jgi:hypothetical protein